MTSYNMRARDSRRTCSPGACSRIGRASALALTLAALAACKDSMVPFFNAPTSIPATKTGIQNTVTGVLSSTRVDVGNYVVWMSAMARDATQFQGTENRFVTELLGRQPIQPDDFIGSTVWDNAFRDAKTLNTMIPVLSHVPGYTTADVQTMTGVAQTLKAYQFMLLAETRDTLGVPIAGIAQPPSAPPAPILCAKDVWAYIVAVLDSGDAALTAAGANPMPVIFPSGFNAVNATATNFVAFNRALAGKANLELAYAAGRPADSTAMGAPPSAVLAAAETDFANSALLDTTALTQPSPNVPLSATDPNGVYLNFSGGAGDTQNPITLANTTLYYVTGFGPDLDSADARVKGKLLPNNFPNATGPLASFAMPCVGVPGCKPASVGITYGEYPTVSAPIPIVRNEELVLLRAQVRIAQGDFVGALAFINAVRTIVGGRPPYPPSVAASYVSIRDALLHEQRLSTTYEGSGDRTISIRFYNLARTRLTTFGAADLHTTVLPIRSTESDARGGNLTVSCP